MPSAHHLWRTESGNRRVGQGPGTEELCRKFPWKALEASGRLWWSERLKEVGAAGLAGLALGELEQAGEGVLGSMWHLPLGHLRKG